MGIHSKFLQKSSGENSLPGLEILIRFCPGFIKKTPAGFSE